MISLSLCMIVKNEHDTLKRCIESVKDIVDEIVIVDTGSTDDTKEIALEYTPNVYDFVWCDDFARARNFSFSKATKEYIMWLDADDVILDEDRKKLRELKENLDKSVDMVWLKYNLGVDENNVPSLTYYRERILKRSMGYKWVGPIHEVICPTGNVKNLDIAITHKKIHHQDSGRNLRIFEKMKREDYPFDARQTFYFARELMYAKRLDESIDKYVEFLDMPDAWSENKISAYIDLNNIYLQLGQKDKALSCLMDALKLGEPRAEVCCRIGQHFVDIKNYMAAKCWYMMALNCPFDESSGGFYIKDYYTFIPNIGLSICFFYLGDIPKAKEYNNRAGVFRPTDKSYLYNKELYEKLL